MNRLKRTKLTKKRDRLHTDTFGMNEDSEKWKIGRFLVKGDRMKNKKKVDSELSLRELKTVLNYFLCPNTNPFSICVTLQLKTLYD